MTATKKRYVFRTAGGGWRAGALAAHLIWAVAANHPDTFYGAGFRNAHRALWQRPDPWTAALILAVFVLLLWIERRRTAPFDWPFACLPALNLLLIIPRVFLRAPALVPLTGLVLMGLMALRVLHYLIAPAVRRFSARWAESPSAPRWLFAVFAVAYAALAVLLAAVKGFSAGDEIYYLRQAQALAEHRTLDMAGVTPGWTFAPEQYAPEHISASSRPGRAYTHHPFGVSLLMMPGWWLGGRWGALLVHAGLSALLGPLLFLVLRREAVPPPTALGVTLLWGLTLPIAIYGARTYPDVPAGLCYLWAYFALRDPAPWRPRRALAAGLALGFAAWLLSRRFVFPVALLNLAALRRGLRERNGCGLAALLWPQAVLVLTLLAFNAWRFPGNPELAAGSSTIAGGSLPWTDLVKLGLRTSSPWRLTKLLGVLYDKRFGLIWTNLFLALFIPFTLFMAFRRARIPRLPLAIFWLTYFCVNGGLWLWDWPSGICHEPRYTVAVLPFLALPFAKWLAERQGGPLGGGPGITIATAILSLIGLLCVPFRFDSIFVAYTELHRGLARLAGALPWHRSFVFYLGPLDLLHILSAGAVFGILGALAFSRFGRRWTPAAFFGALWIGVYILNVIATRS